MLYCKATYLDIPISPPRRWFMFTHSGKKRVTSEKIGKTNRKHFRSTIERCWDQTIFFKMYFVMGDENRVFFLWFCMQTSGISIMAIAGARENNHILDYKTLVDSVSMEAGGWSSFPLSIQPSLPLSHWFGIIENFQIVRQKSDKQKICWRNLESHIPRLSQIWSDILLKL